MNSLILSNTQVFIFVTLCLTLVIVFLVVFGALTCLILKLLDTQRMEIDCLEMANSASYEPLQIPDLEIGQSKYRVSWFALNNTHDDYPPDQLAKQLTHLMVTETKKERPDFYGEEFARTLESFGFHNVKITLVGTEQPADEIVDDQLQALRLTWSKIGL